MLDVVIWIPVVLTAVWLTEEAQVKLGAGENHVFADKALANKRKMVKGVFAPIFLPQLATGVSFFF